MSCSAIKLGREEVFPKYMLLRDWLVICLLGGRWQAFVLV